MLISWTGGCLQSRGILAIQIMHNNTRGHHSPNDAYAVGLYSLHIPSSPYPDLNVVFKKHLISKKHFEFLQQVTIFTDAARRLH